MVGKRHLAYRVMMDERNVLESVVDEFDLSDGVDELNRAVIDVLVDRILVYNENEIEIVWNRRFSQTAQSISLVKSYNIDLTEPSVDKIGSVK